MTRTLTAAAVSAALILTTQHAAAQVYTCTVGDRKVYQSTPCEAGDKPIKLYVPAPADKPANHRINHDTQRFLQQRELKSQRAESVVDRRAREARERRLQKEAAEADKNRISKAKFNDKVVVGMSASDVRDTWGKPDKINPSQYRAGETEEQWVYYESNRTSYVHLTNGKVTSTSTYKH